MLSDLDLLYIKKYAKKTFIVFLICFVFLALGYSCDLDFALKEKNLEKSQENYTESIIKTPVNTSEIFNKKLGLKVVSQIQITGSVLGANQDFLRTTCPFQKERVKEYNNYFSALILSVQGKEKVLLLTPQSRMLKQLLTKITTDPDYLQKIYYRPITIVGYGLSILGFPDIQVDHIAVNQIILNGRIYQ